MKTASVMKGLNIYDGVFSENGRRCFIIDHGCLTGSWTGLFYIFLINPCTSITAQKVTFSIKDSFTEEVLNGKLHFLCNVCSYPEIIYLLHLPFIFTWKRCDNMFNVNLTWCRRGQDLITSLNFYRVIDILWLLTEFICATFGVEFVSLTWNKLPWQPFCQNISIEKIPSKEIFQMTIAITQAIVCFL